MRPTCYSLYFFRKIIRIPCVKVNSFSVLKKDLEGSQFGSSACVKPTAGLKDYSVKGLSPKHKILHRTTPVADNLAHRA